VDGIVSRMHSYRTDLGVFVDREKEAWEVLGFGRGVIRDGTISILYGPRGCGKTTLFAALISSLANFRDRSVEIHYVSIDDAGGNIVAASTNRGLAEELSSRLGSEGFSISFGVSISPFHMIPAGFSLSISVGGKHFEQIDAIAIVREAIDEIVSEGGGGARHVVVVDEYRLSSPEDFNRLKNHIEVFYNRLEHFITKILKARGSSIAYIITASDASVVSLKVGGSKERYAFMWNLPREASDRIATRIGVNENLAWRLAGGNSRALRDIRDSGVGKWIENKVIGGIRIFARGLPIEVRDKALEKISSSLDRVDDIDWLDPSIWEPMLRRNIIIYIADADKISEPPRETWIGREFAFQIPAHYYTLKAMARKRSWEISPEEVIKEAMG